MPYNEGEITRYKNKLNFNSELFDFQRLYKFENITFNVEKLPPTLPDKKMLFDAKIWTLERGNKIILTNCRHIAVIDRKYKKDFI